VSCLRGFACRLRPLPRRATGANRGARRPAARESGVGAAPRRVTTDPESALTPMRSAFGSKERAERSRRRLGRQKRHRGASPSGQEPLGSRTSLHAEQGSNPVSQDWPPRIHAGLDTGRRPKWEWWSDWFLEGMIWLEKPFEFFREFYPSKPSVRKISAHRGLALRCKMGLRSRHSWSE